MDAADNRVVVEETRHSHLGASSAHRWLNCAGSIRLTNKLIEAGTVKPSTSRPAAEGTAAHLVFAACMEDGEDAVSMKDMEIEVDHWLFTVDDEMIAGVQEALTWCRDRISRAKKEGFEVEVYVERGMESLTDEDAYGTGDIIIHIVGDRLIVGDLKYGRGVTVEPDSDQNYYYSYLALENYVTDPDTIKVIESWIFQPRIPHPNGTIRRHVTNVQEVTDWWFKRALPGMEETRNPDAELVIGEWCRFCPAKGNCPALKGEAVEFNTTIDPTHMTDEELGEVLVKLDVLVKALPTFEAEALRRARGGAKIPGRKLVRQKGNRVFKDKQPVKANPDDPDDDTMVEVTLEDAILEAFGMEAYTDPTLKSPAQIEKLEGGNEFAAQWAYSPDKGLTLAKESDKRMEVRPNVERLYGTRKS